MHQNDTYLHFSWYLPLFQYHRFMWSFITCLCRCLCSTAHSFYCDRYWASSQNSPYHCPSSTQTSPGICPPCPAVSLPLLWRPWDVPHVCLSPPCLCCPVESVLPCPLHFLCPPCPPCPEYPEYPLCRECRECPVCEWSCPCGMVSINFNPLDVVCADDKLDNFVCALCRILLLGLTKDGGLTMRLSPYGVEECSASLGPYGGDGGSLGMLMRSGGVGTTIRRICCWVGWS